jgi:hypothetical protein
MQKNALQAVLDRAAQQPAPIADKPVARPARARPAPTTPAPAPKAQDEPAKFSRPSRDGKQLIAGHFPKNVAKQLKLIAVEDDTTVQELLGEALDLLFVKKGKARINDMQRRGEG